MVINPTVGVYIISSIRIPIKGGMTIPNIGSLDPGTCEKGLVSPPSQRFLKWGHKQKPWWQGFGWLFFFLDFFCNWWKQKPYLQYSWLSGISGTHNKKSQHRILVRPNRQKKPQFSVLSFCLMGKIYPIAPSTVLGSEVLHMSQGWTKKFCWCQIRGTIILPSGKPTYSNGISLFLIGNTSPKGPFSIAMLDYWNVTLCVQPLRKPKCFSAQNGLVFCRCFQFPKGSFSFVGMNRQLRVFENCLQRFSLDPLCDWIYVPCFVSRESFWTDVSSFAVFVRPLWP